MFFEAWDWLKNGWDYLGLSGAQIENFHIFFDGETDDNHHWKIRTIPYFSDHPLPCQRPGCYGKHCELGLP